MAKPETTIKRAYVQLQDGQLHLRLLPGAGVPIVMLHQTASSSAMFESLMRRLGGGPPIFALDTPGFGGSFDPAAPATLEQYASWILEAIDQLGIDRFDLVGHHTGGCIGLLLAVRFPERVRSLCVIGPVYMTPDERQAWRQRSDPFTPAWDRQYLAQTWDNLTNLGTQASLELHHRELIDNLRAWKSRSEAYRAVWDSDQPALFAEVACPLLLIAAQDDVLATSLARVLAARPDASRAAIGGANFEPDLDPDGCARAISGFLAELANPER